MTLTCSQLNKINSAAGLVVLILYTGTVISSFIGTIIKIYALAIHTLSCISRLSTLLDFITLTIIELIDE